MALETKHLLIKDLDLEELKALIKKEKNNEQKAIYQEIAERCVQNPKYIEYSTLYQVFLNNILIGIVYFKGAPDLYGALEIWYGVADDYQNNGYATEVVGAMVDFAFNDIHVHSIYGVVDDENVAATRVLVKNKFKLRDEAEEGNVFERFK